VAPDKLAEAFHTHLLTGIAFSTPAFLVAPATHHEDVRFDFAFVGDCLELEAVADIFKVLPDVAHFTARPQAQSSYHLHVYSTHATHQGCATRHVLHCVVYQTHWSHQQICKLWYAVLVFDQVTQTNSTWPSLRAQNTGDYYDQSHKNGELCV